MIGFGTFQLLMLLIWILITASIGYKIFLSFKGRRDQRREINRLRIEQGEEFDPAEHPEPKPILIAILKSKEFWKTLFWAFTTAGFMMFIVEETMQIRGFGRYGLQQGKLWQEAAKASNYSVDAVKRDRAIIKVLTVLNPPAGYVFGRYCDAEEKKLSWEMMRIEKELGKLKSRVTRIEGKLEIRPLTVPDEIGKIAANPAERVFPIATANGGLRYPRQIDYVTAAERGKTSNLVYITKYGAKYHKQSCRSVTGREGVRALTKLDAQQEGKTPCLRCKP